MHSGIRIYYTINFKKLNVYLKYLLKYFLHFIK